MIVADANVIALYLIEGDRTHQAKALKKKDADWVVPSFWSIEFESILWKYVRFGGMPTETALDLLERAMGMFAANEMIPPADIVLRDGLNWGISVYDAQYVSLAKQLGVSCVTEDGDVRTKCPGIAISMEEYLRDSGGPVVKESRAGYGTKPMRKAGRGQKIKGR